jgi:hypothetical protein
MRETLSTSTAASRVTLPDVVKNFSKCMIRILKVSRVKKLFNQSGMEYNYMWQINFSISLTLFYTFTHVYHCVFLKNMA